MHAIGWEAKRLHWRTTWTMIHEFEAHAERLGKPDLAMMTPARYDVMQVLWQRPRWLRRGRGEVYDQSLAVIVAKLGLHLSTVSKCVKRMVELGLLAMSVRIVRKRRYQMLTLTPRGIDAFLDASAIVLGRFLPMHALGAETVRLLRVRARRARQKRPLRERPPRSRDTNDVVLRSVAVALRACAEALGSKAFSIYDPLFDDPLFPLHFGSPPSDTDDPFEDHGVEDVAVAGEPSVGPASLVEPDLLGDDWLSFLLAREQRSSS